MAVEQKKIKINLINLNLNSGVTKLIESRMR